MLFLASEIAPHFLAPGPFLFQQSQQQLVKFTLHPITLDSSSASLFQYLWILVIPLNPPGQSRIIALSYGQWTLISSATLVPFCHLLLFSHQVMSSSFVTPWTVAHQSPLSMGFPRQEYRSGLPFPYPGDLSDPDFEPVYPALASRLSLSRQGRPSLCHRSEFIHSSPGD